MATVAQLRSWASAVSPLDGQTVSHLYLTLSRRVLPRGERVRLAGRAGPFGRICTVKARDDDAFDVVAVFKAAEVRRFCDRLDATPEPR